MAMALRLARACALHDGDAILRQHALALDLLLTVSLDTPVMRSSTSTDAPAWLHRVREQLDHSLGATITIAALARTAGVHPVHLARVFRR